MDNFIGEIRPFAFNWYPNDWLPCDGRQLMVNQYQALYAVIGNLYGGTSNVNFNLPNLQGAVCVGAGIAATQTPYIQGSTGATGGADSVTLTQTTIPSHSHTFNGAVGGGVNRKSVPADLNSYISNFGYTASGAATSAPTFGYVTNPPSSPDTQLNNASISPAGGGLLHENRQPYLTINYCIAYVGNFPIRP